MKFIKKLSIIPIFFTLHLVEWIEKKGVREFSEEKIIDTNLVVARTLAAVLTALLFLLGQSIFYKIRILISVFYDGPNE